MNFDCAIGIRRNQALQIRAVDFDIFVHPERDPGVLQQGVALLNEINALQKYRYALLLFDREGCGTGGSHPFRAGTAGTTTARHEWMARTLCSGCDRPRA